MKPKRKARFPWFREGDFIVTAYAQSAPGPGWGNSPLWVIVRDAAGVLREECIQPEEQTETMHLLYRASADIHTQLCGAILTAREVGPGWKRVKA